MDYTIVVQTDLIEFTKRVLCLLQAGWELQGGVSIAVSESDEYKYTYYAQALIKKPRGIIRA